MSSNGKELLCLISKSLRIWGDDIIRGSTGTDTFEVGKGLIGLAGGLSFGPVSIS